MKKKNKEPDLFDELVDFFRKEEIKKRTSLCFRFFSTENDKYEREFLGSFYLKKCQLDKQNDNL